MSNRDTNAILEYHEATKHSEWSVRTHRHALDWQNQPLPFKIYRDLETIPLVREFAEKDVSALDAIARSAEPRSASESGERIPDLLVLSRLLYLSAGITKQRRHQGGSVYFRAYPNTGALHHVDLYVVAGELPDLAAGVYHFAPHNFSLGRLREGDFREVLLEASGDSPYLVHAPLVLASASTYWRNSWKYQARAWRHCFWDAGTLHANLLAVAASEQLDPCIVLGWADRPVQQLLGLDPRSEGALTLVPLGHSASRPPAAPKQKALQLETELLSRRPVDYPAIRGAQGASSLSDAVEATAWRQPALAPEWRAPLGPLTRLRPAPNGSENGASLDRVIRRRGSTRVFDRSRSIRFEELSTALERSCRGVPADWIDPHRGTLLDLYLIVNAVDGLPPGAYAYRDPDRSLELLREGDFRQNAGRLALGQQLAADAAVNVYSLSDLALVLGRFGNRGYRAAQLEGGVVGGRLYLSAYAQGFGATGLTFFDDEVAEFFSPHAAGKSVMFLVALGHPDRAALGLVS